MAKQFKFRLEVVGRVRRLTEQAAQRAVARRVGEIQALDARITAADAALEELVREARAAASPGHTDVPLMARQRHAMGRLRQHREACLRQRGELLEHLRRDRAALTEASRQVKVIDKLRDQALGAYAREAQRAENAQADELAVQRYVHGIIHGE